MPASSLGVSEATKGRVRLQHRLFTERLSCVENHARPRSSVLGRAGMDFTLGCYKLSRARETHRWPQSTWGRGVPEPRGSEHRPTRGSRSQSWDWISREGRGRGWRHPVKVVHARAAWLRLAGSASQGWWHWKSCGMKDAPSRRREQWQCGVRSQSLLWEEVAWVGKGR